MSLPIQTERLLIRPATFDDLDAMHTAFSDPVVMQYIPDGACRRSESRAKLASYIDHQAAHGFSKWAVVERTSGTVIGDCGLRFLDGGSQIDLGFHLARRYWGQGYATEAADACLAWAFKELNRESVVAIVDPVNIASVRVLTKIGMKREGWATYFGRRWHFYIARSQSPGTAPTARSSGGASMKGQDDQERGVG